MNSRRDRLRSLFSGADEAGEAAARPPQGEGGPARAASGAVRAMGLSLDALSQEIEEARQLRQNLSAGERVVEIDPQMIERSPFADRLSLGAQNDEAFEALKESLRHSGQQVPVLLRPHPDPQKAAAGHYQSAYGHRRIEAARQLGLKVRAIVRPLTDAELALAQGKENADRRDLSFIERAFFAATLLRHGFDRAAAQAALSVHKTEMTRLLQVAETIPQQIMSAIGPAPKVGRPRWLALGGLLEAESARKLAAAEIQSRAFKETSDSDRRFQMLFDRLSRRDASPPTVDIVQAGERTIAKVTKRDSGTVIAFSKDVDSRFADHVAAELPQLYAAFIAQKEDR